MNVPRPRVGVMPTLIELYRKLDGETPKKLGAMWRRTVEEALSKEAELHFTDVACTEAETAAAVASCEKAGCDLLIVLPLAYATSGSARSALVATNLPLLLVSTARDATLPVDMGDDHIMANHAVHGVQDMANVLGGAGRPFEVIAGHFSNPEFRRRLVGCIRAAAAARVLRRGRITRVGKTFEGMLDFQFEAKQLAALPLLAGGLKAFDVDAAAFAAKARAIDKKRSAELARSCRKDFDVDPSMTAEEFDASARAALALEDLVDAERLDGLSMSFLDLAASGAETMPFLGASRLLARGVGYAGEGDALTAALVAAAARIADEATFTEMFCPDYARAEVLLSHMGECNIAMANPRTRVKLVAKPFVFGKCLRPAVPVFQLRPGTVTLASLFVQPGEGLRLVVAPAEVVEAADHVNLRSPWSRITFGRALEGFLEDYSRAGGTHHLALAYGDRREEFRRWSGLCGVKVVTV